MDETTSLYRGSPGKIFLQYAAPQALALLANTGYAIVDGVFIGARLGPSALAATGVAVPAFELLIALSMAATAGAGVVVSTRLAEGDRERAVRAFNTSMALQGAIGLAIVVLSNIFMDSLVRILGAPSEIHDATATYLRYLLSFSPFLLYGYMLGGLARNDGRPGLAAAALTIGSVANILLDYVFMYPLNMGIAGAALASGIGPVVSVLILLPHFLTERKGVLLFKRVRLSFSDAGRILKLGVPSFVLEFSIGTVTFVMNYGIVRYGYGSNGLAVYLIVGYLALVVLTLFYGMAEGLQPAFSYLCAAGERKKLRALLNVGIGVFLGTGLVSYLLILFFSIHFYRMFTPGSEVTAIFAAEKSAPYFSGFICAGLNILAISYYQATSATGRSLFLATLRGFVLPAVLVAFLPYVFGAERLWLCHSLAEVSTLAIFVIIVLARRFY